MTEHVDFDCTWPIVMEKALTRARFYTEALTDGELMALNNLRGKVWYLCNDNKGVKQEGAKTQLLTTLGHWCKDVHARNACFSQYQQRVMLMYLSYVFKGFTHEYLLMRDIDEEAYPYVMENYRPMLG